MASWWDGVELAGATLDRVKLTTLLFWWFEKPEWRDRGRGCEGEERLRERRERAGEEFSPVLSCEEQLEADGGWVMRRRGHGQGGGQEEKKKN